MTLHRLPTFQSYRLLPRFIHTSRTTRQPNSNPPNPVSHGAEAYFVDGDDTQPNTTVYKVDATSDAAESAYEPPSGPWSRAGAGTEYQTLSKDEPYDVQTPNIKLRYGGRTRYTDDQGPETSKVGESPEGTERWGRKPEGRT
ncbi:hypothetical protein JVU11DRAFT_2132 [Chiua virens]|nr:hypothetical protein JVU11DRAFT_2132 [Chiua virens]